MIWLTFTGVELNSYALRPQDVNVVDIAHHLAQTNRYKGALRVPYSVAQHSVLVYRAVARVLDFGKIEAAVAPDELGVLLSPAERAIGHWRALLHDAAEYVLGDRITPEKVNDPEFCAAEDRALAAIHTALKVPDQPETNDIIKVIDKRIREDEVRCLGSDAMRARWVQRHQPLGITIEPWSFERARDEYLGAHYDLARRCAGWNGPRA